MLRGVNVENKHDYCKCMSRITNMVHNPTRFGAISIHTYVCTNQPIYMSLWLLASVKCFRLRFMT
jgi:hypothetical protein